MSSAKGSSNRKRPQKHQNRTAFKNDLHDTSQRTKFLNTLEISGVCKRCKEILEWKIKYKKYKPLTAPRKCSHCEQKTIKHAYHMLCNQCAKMKKGCPKCCKAFEDDKVIDETHNASQSIDTVDIKSMLKGLPERKRRTIMRLINKQDDQELTPDVISQVEEMMSKMGKVNLNDGDRFFDEGFSDSDGGDEDGL